jgi:hypothetical protein
MGVVASMVAGIVLNKYHKYLLMVRLAAFGTAIILGLALFTYGTKNVDLISVNMIAGACCMVPIIPVSIDFSAELTFPQDETVTTGFLLMSSQAFGFFFSIFVLELCVKVNSLSGLGAIVACAWGASFITLFIKEDLRRIKFTENFTQLKQEPVEELKSSVALSSKYGP